MYKQYNETYVPSEGSNDVVICLSPLGVEYDNYPERQTIIDANPDKIVIFYDASAAHGNGDANVLDELNRLGVGGDANIQVYTSSSGDTHSFATAELLNNSGYHTSDVVIFDPAYPLDTSRQFITSEQARNFAEHDTSVLIGCQYAHDGISQNGLNTLITAGVPLSYVYFNRGDHSWDDNHSYVKNNMLENGVVELLYGDKATFDDGIYSKCEYSVYDYETGSWNDNLTTEQFCGVVGGNSRFDLLDSRLGYLKEIPELNASDISASLGYTGGVSSSQQYVVDKMNGVRAAVRRTNFIGKLGLNIGSIGGNPLLDFESSILMDTFATSGILLDKIVGETETISGIAFDFDKLDKNLASISTDLGTPLTLNNLLSYNFNQYGVSSELARQMNGGYHMDLSKYSEAPERGFELFLSNRIYNLSDFDSAYAREHYGYNSEQALEAFIGVCIAESDKTPDGLLSVMSVALNRCESDNWSSYYTRGATNGTLPFDQMFVNDGAQYSQIKNIAPNGRHVYENYMPCIAGEDAINEHLAGYGTDYQTLRTVAMDALAGGLRNSDYTGFRAYIPSKYHGNYLDPSSGLFLYENGDKDTPFALANKNQRISISTASTSYTGKETIKVTQVSGAPQAVALSSVPSDLPGASASSLAVSSTTSTSSSTSSTSSGSGSYGGNSYYSTSSSSQSTYATSSGTSLENTNPTGPNSDSLLDQGTITDATNSVDDLNTVTPVNTSNSNTVTTTTYSQTSYTNSAPSSGNSSPTVSITQVEDNNLNTNATNTIDSSETTINNNHIISESSNNYIENNHSFNNNKNEEIYVSQSVNETTNSNKHNNNTLKTVGGIAAGAALAGGLAYSGMKFVKNVKNNNDLDEDEDEDGDREEGDI